MDGYGKFAEGNEGVPVLVGGVTAHTRSMRRLSLFGEFVILALAVLVVLCLFPLFTASAAFPHPYYWEMRFIIYDSFPPNHPFMDYLPEGNGFNGYSIRMDARDREDTLIL